MKLRDAESFLEGLRALRAEVGGAKGSRVPSPAKLKKMVDSFDWAAWNAEAKAVLADPIRAVAVEQARKTASGLDASFDEHDPWVDRRLTAYVGARIKDLDRTTREEVADLIRDRLASDDGTGSTGALGDEIADLVREKFDGYADWRADRIARAETAIAYNYGDVFGYRAAGITHVQVLDDGEGFDCDCAQVNGQIWTLEEALENPIGHPGCVRSFVAATKE